MRASCSAHEPTDADRAHPAPENIRTLFSIVNDSLEVKSKLQSGRGDLVNFNGDCISYVEYSEFNKGTFCYYVNDCNECETRQCVKNIQPFVKFIDSLCDKELEFSNLNKKLPGNMHGKYWSLTQCCCGHEF